MITLVETTPLMVVTTILEPVSCCVVDGLLEEVLGTDVDNAALLLSSLTALVCIVVGAAVDD